MAGRNIEIPSAAVLRAVAKPGQLLMAAPDLTKLSAGIALSIALLTLNPVFGIFGFFPVHLVMMWLSYRDPYIVEVVKAKYRCSRTRNLSGGQGHRYVA